MGYAGVVTFNGTPGIPLEMKPVTLDQRDELSQIGDSVLMEYEPRLKERVRGVRPYNGLYAKQIAQYYKDSLLPGRADVELKVRSVLDELVAQDDGLWMSEPDNEALSRQNSTQRWMIERSGVQLTFQYGYDIETDQQQLCVKCWYYPATYSTR